MHRALTRSVGEQLHFNVHPSKTYFGADAPQRAKQLLALHHDVSGKLNVKCFLACKLYFSLCFLSFFLVRFSVCTRAKWLNIHKVIASVSQKEPSDILIVTIIDCVRK